MREHRRAINFLSSTHVYSRYTQAERKRWNWARATGAARDHRDRVATALSRDRWAELKPGKKRSGEPEAREAEREDRPNGSDLKMKGGRWRRHEDASIALPGHASRSRMERAAVAREGERIAEEGVKR